jgi:hypothetical protein
MEYRFIKECHYCPFFIRQKLDENNIADRFYLWYSPMRLPHIWLFIWLCFWIICHVIWYSPMRLPQLLSHTKMETINYPLFPTLSPIPNFRIRKRITQPSTYQYINRGQIRELSVIKLKKINETKYKLESKKVLLFIHSCI